MRKSIILRDLTIITKLFLLLYYQFTFLLYLIKTAACAVGFEINTSDLNNCLNKFAIRFLSRHTQSAIISYLSFFGVKKLS